MTFGRKRDLTVRTVRIVLTFTTSVISAIKRTVGRTMMRKAPAYGPPISSKKMVARTLRTVGTFRKLFQGLLVKGADAHQICEQRHLA